MSIDNCEYSQNFKSIFQNEILSAMAVIHWWRNERKKQIQIANGKKPWLKEKPSLLLPSLDAIIRFSFFYFQKKKLQIARKPTIAFVHAINPLRRQKMFTSHVNKIYI